MIESYVCPKCNSTKFIGYDDASGAECKECGHFIPDNELDNYAYVKIKKSELARRDEIIKRLKEDADRLASTYVVEVFPHEWACRGGCHHWARFGEQIDHAPDCPITLHRALMKELK